MIKTEDFSDLETLIAKNSRLVEDYKQRQRKAYDNRKRNPSAWRAFCKQPYPDFPISKYLMRFENPADAEALTFALRFLALDPWFDQSGYIKAFFLRKLKSRDLTAKQTDYVNDILLDAVEHRGQREFKDYCRLARKIATAKLIHHLEVITQHGVWDSRQSRAALMLESIRQAERMGER